MPSGDVYKRQIENKGKQAKSHDNYRAPGYKYLCAHLIGNRDAEENGNQVCKRTLRRLRQALQAAAFTDQVAEHQEADERHGIGSNKAGNNGDDDREQDAGGLADLRRIVGHPDHALLLRGNETDAQQMCIRDRYSITYRLHKIQNFM